jgi:alkylhydroperoxidase family enzyme
MIDGPIGRRSLFLMILLRTLTPIAAALALAGSAAPSRAGPEDGPRFPALGDEEAWKRLPRERMALPAWARALAGSLPATAAAMLELDHLHRAASPLGPELYGKLRWAAADADGCVYSKRYAEADLRRAGLGDDDLKRLADDARGLPEAERVALAFARKLTRAAHTVSDEEVAELLRHHGPEKVVAIVHTLAYANFQDRLLLALGVEVEAGGPLPPLPVRFDPEARKQAAAPARPPWQEARGARADAPGAAPDWLDRGFADVQRALERQKGRAARIPPPGPERLARLPAELRARAGDIVWSRVSFGYQLALTRAWFDCLSAFQQEARLDPVFANTFFWVITRSNDCFY